MNKSYSVSNYDYRLAYNSGTGFRFRVSADTYVDSGAVTANAWHLVIAWHDSVHDTINIQVDDGAVQTKTFATGTMNTTNPLTMGALADGTYGLDGRLDEVALYRRVLTDAERTWLYNSAAGRTYSDVVGAAAYTYGDAAHSHAVTALSNGSGYEYDANGNQTTRIIGADTYLLLYDAENRLWQVCKDTTLNPGTCDSNEIVAEFTYNGDGKRVKSVIGSETTLFIGSHYEITNPGVGQTITKYYFAGTQRIALRKYAIPSSMTVEYLLSDHLGSTSLTTDKNGAKISEMRYTAWGQVRYAWTSGAASTPTYKLSSYTYTGQFSDSYTNLLWYGSRHYDPALGRFIQPDSIVPLASQGVQAWDRYAYVNNNPVRFTDPTGHEIPCGAFCSFWSSVSNWWTGNGTGWGHPVRRAIAERLDLPKTASNLPEFLIHSMLHEPSITLTGYDDVKGANDALPEVQRDPAFLEVQDNLIQEVQNNPKYGDEAFTDGGNFYWPEFGGNRDPEDMGQQILNPGEYQNTWEVARNQLTWMIRHATVGGRADVAADGSMQITWTLHDVAYLTPKTTRSDAYNIAVSNLGFIYHNLLGGSTKMEVNANWTYYHP
jgi:RHS repeat-associated protein